MSAKRPDESDEAQAVESSERAADPEFQHVLQREVSQAIQPVVRDLQGQIAQVVRQHMQQEASPNQMQNETSTTQDAFQEAAESLRETFVWLGRTVRALLETVRSLLQTVGLLLRAILSALTQGLRSLWQSIVDAIRSRIIEAIISRIREWVEAFIRRFIMSWFTSEEQAQEAA
jgi:hypothetical protein